MPPNKTRLLSLQDELAALNLEIQKTRLALLDGPKPQKVNQDVPYEEIPPLSPEDRKRMERDVERLIGDVEGHHERQKRAWYLSMTAFAP